MISRINIQRYQSQKTAINAAYKGLVLVINFNYKSQINENVSNFEESEI